MADFDPYYQWLAIPLKDQPPNHYRLLGVETFESNADVIRRVPRTSRWPTSARSRPANTRLYRRDY